MNHELTKEQFEQKVNGMISAGMCFDLPYVHEQHNQKQLFVLVRQALEWLKKNSPNLELEFFYVIDSTGWRTRFYITSPYPMGYYIAGQDIGRVFHTFRPTVNQQNTIDENT